MADANGILVSPRSVLERVLATAIEDDNEEPHLIAAIRKGQRLGELTGATEMVDRLLDVQRVS